MHVISVFGKILSLQSELLAQHHWLVYIVKLTPISWCAPARKALTNWAPLGPQCTHLEFAIQILGQACMRLIYIAVKPVSK
jgi:hypothetical protein